MIFERTSFSKGMPRNFFRSSRFLWIKEIGNGAVVCLASDVIPIDKKNAYVPA